MKQRVFIGSSSEGLAVAEALQLQLDQHAEVTVWTDNIFSLSQSNYSSLERELGNSDFGVFILTLDDLVTSRNETMASPRDNVIFELGLFAGRLGLSKTIIVHPRKQNLKIPSDLHGIVTATYEVHSDKNLAASLGAVCTKIKLHIENSVWPENFLTWNETCDMVEELASKLRKSPAFGGFSFDVIVGITRGGIIIADLLSRHFGGQIPVMSLWADRHTQYPHTCFEPPDNWVNGHILPVLSLRRVKNILVVDDITRTGSTLSKAKSFLEKSLPQKKIKSAVLIMDEAVDEDNIDFFVEKISTKNVKTPFSRLD